MLIEHRELANMNEGRTNVYSEDRLQLKEVLLRMLDAFNWVKQGSLYLPSGVDITATFEGGRNIELSGLSESESKVL